MSSQWRHNICLLCWDRKNPDREPHRVLEEFCQNEPCCYCGQLNRDGIYIREHPESAELQGCHGQHADDG